MLLGEHAVLRGYPAIVCALNQRLTVTLTPRNDDHIYLESNTLGSFKTHRLAMSIEQPFSFVLAAINEFRHQLSTGFHLIITSTFSEKMGLGSSSAVTVATVGALQQWLQQRMDRHMIYQASIRAVRQVQKLGSGADVAASTFGGAILYQLMNQHDDSWDYQITPLMLAQKFFLIYVGYKTKTAEVVNYVTQNALKNPEKYDRLFREIGHQTRQGATSIQQHNWKTLGIIMQQSYQLQKALGVSDDVIDSLVSCLSQQKNVMGVKISGSGLGDCVIVLGEIESNSILKAMTVIPATIDSEGVRYEST